MIEIYIMNILYISSLLCNVIHIYESADKTQHFDLVWLEVVITHFPDQAKRFSFVGEAAALRSCRNQSHQPFSEVTSLGFPQVLQAFPDFY